MRGGQGQGRGRGQEGRRAGGRGSLRRWHVVSRQIAEQTCIPSSTGTSHIYMSLFLCHIYMCNSRHNFFPIFTKSLVFLCIQTSLMLTFLDKDVTGVGGGGG